METKKNQKRETEAIRITKIQGIKLKKMGGKTMADNLDRLFKFYESIKKNPEEICMNHISDFMDDVDKFYGSNHVSHMKNIPAAIRKGLRRGGNCDFSIVNKRPDKTIDKFMEETNGK